MANLVPYFAGWLWAMNSNTWKSLDEKQRRILLDTIAESTVETEIAYVKAGDEAVQESSKHGVTVYQPTDDITQSIASFHEHARAMALKEGAERFKLTDSEGQIGRASGRERVCKYVSRWVVG